MENRLNMAADNNKFRSVFLVFFLICNSCSHVKPENNQQVDNVSKDTLKSINEDFEEFTFEDVQNQFNELYENSIYQDSIIVVGRDTMQFKLEHCSLSDSILVPQKYNWGKNKFDYLVYNFASRISILKDKKVLVDTVVKKEAFLNFLDDNLKKYGVLLYPSCQGFDSTNRSCIITYSISIPCTDVGKLVTLEIGLNSAIKTY
jgi:hypothetical protein